MLARSNDGGPERAWEASSAYVLVVVDKALHAHRRRLVILCTMAVLGASVVSAHSALAGGDHMGMGVAMCLAVVDTAAAVAVI